MRDSLLRTDKEIAGIYERYAETVYRIALMMLKSIAEAQDVTQNVFIKLITYEKPLESEEHLKAWLIVTTQNACRNILKQWWWAKRVDADGVLEQAFAFDKHEAETWDMLAALPEKQKLPIYLHYFEGYGTEEIADMLGIKHSTVRTRLWSARKKLKLLLEEGQYES